MKPWLYNNTEINNIEDMPTNSVGFIYIITNLNTNEYYIGKKSLMHSHSRKIGKKEKALIEGKGRRPTVEKTLKESDWKSYMSSSDTIKNDIKTNGSDHYKREILEFAFSKKILNYLEIKEQFKRDVLRDKLCLCSNINGKWYKKDFEGEDD